MPIRSVGEPEISDRRQTDRPNVKIMLSVSILEQNESENNYQIIIVQDKERHACDRRDHQLTGFFRKNPGDHPVEQLAANDLPYNEK